jgi:hypothetical protein
MPLLPPDRAVRRRAAVVERPIRRCHGLVVCDADVRRVDRPEPVCSHPRSPRTVEDGRGLQCNGWLVSVWRLAWWTEAATANLGEEA